MVTRISIRTCVGCGLEKPKNDLVRVVRTVGTASIDPEGRRAGRGAYLCPSNGCFDAAAKKNSLAKSLSSDIKADRMIELRKDFNKYINEINRERQHA